MEWPAWRYVKGDGDEVARRGALLCIDVTNTFAAGERVNKPKGYPVGEIMRATTRHCWWAGEHIEALQPLSTHRRVHYSLAAVGLPAILVQICHAYWSLQFRILKI